MMMRSLVMFFSFDSFLFRGREASTDGLVDRTPMSFITSLGAKTKSREVLVAHYARIESEFALLLRERQTDIQSTRVRGRVMCPKDMSDRGRV